MPGSVMMLPQMPKFSNSSNANLTPIYIQPTAPQVPPALNADDLKQVYIVKEMKIIYC